MTHLEIEYQPLPVNSAPIGIGLSNTTVNHSAGANAVVGTLTTVDADADDTHMYELVTGEGDNERFTIDGDQLRANDASQLAAGTYSVRIRTTDTGNVSYDEIFEITVVDDVAPSFTNGTPTLSGTTKTGTTLTVQLNEPGMVYYVVVADGAEAPSVAQVREGHNDQDVYALQHGNVVVNAAGVDATDVITGLQPGTAYDVYVVAVDNASNAQSTVTKQDVTTLVNSVPSDISLSYASVNQSGGANAAVGTLTTVDADGTDTHEYTLVTGEGSTHNTSFAIDGDELRANDASQLAAGTYSVRIRTTDEEEAFYDKIFQIIVVDDVVPSFTNGTPTLSGTTKTGTTLTVQLDEPGTVYYVVVADGAAAPSVAQVRQGYNDQGVSALQSGNVVVNTTDDGATDVITGLAPGTAYDVYVVAVDNASNAQSEVTKQDVTTLANNPPTGIGLSNTIVNQSAGANATVGTLTTVDADETDTHEYTLVTGEGSTDNTSFNIDGDQLRANNASQLAVDTDLVGMGFVPGPGPWPAPWGTYSVRIRTTDTGGAFYDEIFEIIVADDVVPSFTNGTPTLSGTTKTGTTLTVQLDEPGMVYYVVVADGAAAPSVAQVRQGHNDQGVQALQHGNVVVNAADADATGAITGLEPGTAYDVYVVAIDNVSNVQSAVTQRDVTTVSNSVPTDIGLSNASVNHSAGANAAVGTLTTIDADGTDTHAYTLVTGEGSTHNTSFAIDGDQLRANDASQLAAGTYSVRIRTTDNDGGAYEESFTVTVVDDVAPSFTNGTPMLSDTTKTGTTLTVQLDEPGTVYYVVVTDGAAAPSVAQVRQGHNDQGEPALQSGNVVVTAVGADVTDAITGLEPGMAYDVYVVAVDSASNAQSAQRDVTTVSNSAPMDISLSNASVNQSGGANAAVGTLTTTDADAEDTHTYTLVAGGGSTHNASFTIDGDQLQANDASQLAAGTYSVRIRTTDTGNAFYDEIFEITVVDDVVPSFTNGTPTLSDTTKTGTTLTVQLDEPGTVYYVVVADGAAAPSVAQVRQGHNDQGVQALQHGNVVVNAADADVTDAITGLESGTDYDVYVVAVDNASNAQNTVTQRDVTTVSNSVPTDIGLSNASVNQSAGANAAVGTLTTIDADGTDTHAYTLVTGEGSTHNTSFTIDGDQLRANDASQLAAGTYSVRIRTTDNDGGTYEEAFTITVVDDIAPSFTSGTPTLSDTTKTGTTLTVQLDEPGTVYYVVVADGAAAPSVAQVRQGYNDQGVSALQSGNVTVNAGGVDATGTITGLEPGTAYDVYVVAVDSASNAQNTVTKQDVTTVFNSAPTDISLSHASVNQSSGANAAVGTLTTTDADAEDTHTYELAAGGGSTNNASFTIDGDQLRANDASQLAAGTYSVRIRTTDNDGGTYEESFTITVVDDIAPNAPVIEVPVNGSLINAMPPAISGTAEAGSTVEVFRNGNSLDTVSVNGTGSWTLATVTPWADGTYNVTAAATDAAGNTSVQSDAVEVTLDTTPPTITLNGNVNTRIVAGTAYTDAGASAADTRQGNVSADILVTNPVDSNVIGTYTVTYNVSDDLGNAATAVQRTVTVIPPTVAVAGSSGGARTVSVSSAIPGATLTLYDRLHDQVGHSGTAAGDGTFVFSGVQVGRGYYVTQTVNGIASNPSLAADVRASDSTSTQPALGGTVRQVPVAVDGKSPAEQVEIVRKINSSGKSEDAVVLDEAKTASVVEMALEQGRTMVSILIDDLPEDPAEEVTVSVVRSAVQQLSSSGIALEIRTSHATIQLSQDTLRALEQQGIDLYFRVVPIRDEQEKQQVTERTVTAEQVLSVAGSGTIGVIGTPMVIETNYTNYKTYVIFPLQGIELPDNPVKLQQLLDSLAVYVEHSDGEKKVQRGRIVFDESGRPAGIEIEVSKFSTFTVFSFSNDAAHAPYVSGYTDGTFAPDRVVTRAELAAMLSRLLADRLTGETAAVAYSDVSDTHWAVPYMAAVQQLGLMGGYPDGTFRPDQSVTRAEYANAVVRLLTGISGDRPYAANDIEGHWAYSSIIRALATGTMSGYEDGTFRPNEGLTRAEAVSALNRLFERPPLRGAENRYSDVRLSHWAYGDIMEASIEHQSSIHAEE